MSAMMASMRWKIRGVSVVSTQSIVMLCLVVGNQATRATPALNEDVFMVPTIAIEQPLHFIGAEGSDQLVNPGLYRVERRADGRLVLLSELERQETVVEAVKGIHDLEVAEPVAGLVREADDRYHLLFILPGGERLEAVGTGSGVRSRAPSTTLSNVQVSQAMSAATASSGLLAKDTGLLGAPPLPVLVSPIPQDRLARPSIEFKWTPGMGQPAATSFQLCIAEVGKPCVRPGESSTTSVVVPHIPAGDGRFEIDIRLAERLLLPFRGERSLTWTVAACAPSQISNTMGQINPITCRYARPSPLFWTPRLNPPLPWSPGLGDVVNDRPQLGNGGSWNAHHYLFCISTVPGSSSSGCGQGSFVVNTGSNRSMTGWEWGSLLNGSPRGLPANVYAGRTARWSTAACLDDAHCSWSDNASWVRVLPAPTLNTPLTYTYSSSAQHEFVWTAPSETHSWITHYRLCFATQGTALVQGTRTLLDIPGMLRDLCSDDIPPGEQPANRKPIPAPFASLCPSSGCRMPEPVTTIYTTQPRWIINLREHPEWDRFANQTVVWTAAACNGSNRNCMWQTSQYGTIMFPPASHEPRWGPIRAGQAVALNWEPVAGNAYYVPCVREASASCDNGNLLGTTRLLSRGGSPSDHPSGCTLRGPYPSGPKVVQVAGCNDVWGCRWSAAEPMDLGTNQAGHRTESRFDCR